MVINNDFFNAGMVVGVGIPLLITTAIFIVICVARRRRHTLKTGGKRDHTKKSLISSVDCSLHAFKL